MALCECGCGQEPKTEGSRFLRGHHWRIRPLSEDHKQRMAEGRRGNKWSAERRFKRSGANHHYWGKHRSREVKRKISEKLRGKPLPEKTKRKISLVLKGRSVSEETRAKISASRMGIPCPEAAKRFGSANPMWRGGTSNRGHGPEFTDELKLAVRQRDGFTCQLCGRKENSRTHHCHHIDYDKHNNAAENLVTLCLRCHGLTGAGRPYWQTLLEMRRGLRLLPDMSIMAI